MKKTKAQANPPTTLTISVPVELLISRITDATKSQLPALKKSLVEIDAAKAIATASNAAAFKEPLEKLKTAAVAGDATALKTLTDAGGPAEWLKAATAMHPIHQASAERVAKKSGPAWVQFCEDAERIVDEVDAALFDEWTIAAAAMGIPVRKQLGQFAADRYPSEPLVAAVRHSLRNVRNVAATNPKGNLKHSLVLARVFDL